MTLNREWLEAWAARYPIAYDSRLAEIANTEPTFDDVRWIVGWKSQRSLGYFSRNSPKDVEAAVSAALGETDDLPALMDLVPLHGVQARIASAILAAYQPERFTVMDRRAYKTLVETGEMADLRDSTWRQTWPPYLVICRSLATRSDLSLRQVDRALYEANGKTGWPKD